MHIPLFTQKIGRPLRGPAILGQGGMGLAYLPKTHRIPIGPGIRLFAARSQGNDSRHSRSGKADQKRSLCRKYSFYISGRDQVALSSFG